MRISKTLIIMKNFFLFSLLFVFGISIYSCSKSDDAQESSVYVYKTEDIIPIGNATSLNSVSSNIPKIKFDTKINSSIPLSAKMSIEEINRTIIDRKANISVEYIIDDQHYEAVKIVEGVDQNIVLQNKLCSTCERGKDGRIKDSRDCSTLGVKQCSFAQYQNWSSARIIYESFSGGAQEVMTDCIKRNCIGL